MVMGKIEIFELMKKETPFFLNDFVEKYKEVVKSYNNVWNFIQMHKELFSHEEVSSGRKGRPKKLYTVISYEI